ncbi:MAG: hypothetical protein NVS1B14_06220 [Vulcanimicrobiaceae bacterium]
MPVDSIRPERRSGLTTALNVILAPRKAFETLRIAPMWGWAFLIALVLGIIGSYLALPAQMHALHPTLVHLLATDPRMAHLPDAQRAQQMVMSESIGRYSALLAPPLVLLFICIIATAIFLIFNAAAHGRGTFTTLWASTMNVGVVGFGLYQLVNGILAVVRGPNGYNSTLDSLLSMPSLAWLVPHAAPKTIGFLAGFNPFTIWVFLLNILLLTIVARLAQGPAYIASALLLIVGSLFTMFAAR